MCLEVLKLSHREVEEPQYHHWYRRWLHIFSRKRRRQQHSRKREVIDEVLASHVPIKVVDMEATLNLDSLLRMSPAVNGVDLVGRSARQLFLSYVKSQACVKEIFFHDHTPDPKEEHVNQNWFDFDGFAASFVCQTICNIRDPYDIHTMLDSQKVDEIMADFYLSPYWKKAGFALYTMLFPDQVRDPQTLLSFRAFMEDDRHHWGHLLFDKMKDTKWLYSVVRPVVKGESSESEVARNMNILFVKLHLLDPTLVFTAFDHMSKALPDLNLELATTNYLGEPLDWLSIQLDVERALHKPTMPTNAKRLSMDEYEVYFGVQVTEFIMDVGREIGVWSGQYPDNKRISTPKDRCSIM